MEKWSAVAQVVAPIFAAVFIGIWARRRNLLTLKEVKGMQQYVMSFGLPCVLFNSCLGATMNAESLASFAMVFPTILLSVLFAFFVLRKRMPYHNLPMLFAAQESGMLGIPLYMTLFGAAHVFKMGVLDLAQSLVCIATIAILAADTGENPTPAAIARQVLRSPLLLLSAAGLILNVTGAKGALDQMGVMAVITEVTEFIAQPVSALMLFSVGFSLSLSEGNRSVIMRLCAIHFVLLAAAGLVMQGVMFLLPQVEAETRFAILMYTTLPGSYIATTLGRTQEETEIASGVCSLLTIVSLVVFCVIAVCVA
ncbi:MAG: AEC family transporter [Clostridia bacterium]|nr:AEC family transporter [Clostridia bacterium]